MKDYGIFLIDKPAGISSFDVIRQLRKVTGIRKMGHTGTLDPFASGVLPILFGKATRLANKFLAQDKEYLVRMRFGEKTTTGDLEGDVCERSSIIPDSIDQIIAMYDNIIAMNTQIPPTFSALKVNGKKAYELARKGKEFELKPRAISIKEFDLISYDVPFLVYRAKVSKGTYIRRLSEDIASIMGTIAVTDKLRRISSGNINITNTVKLEKINSENWEKCTASISDLLKYDYPVVKIEEKKLEPFKHGNRFTVDYEDQEAVVITNDNGCCIGFGRIEEQILKPEVVLI